MQNFFGYLFLLSLLILIFGMFKPASVIRWGTIRNRKKVLLTYGLATFAFMMLTGMTAPKLTAEQIMAKESIKQAQIQQDANVKADKQAKEDADKKAKADQQAKEEAEKNKPKLEVIEHHSESSNYTGYVVGTVRNNTDKKYGYAQVSINLYDDANNQVGSTMANVNNLEPHGQWKFKAPVLHDGVKKYKIAEVNGF